MYHNYVQEPFSLLKLPEKSDIKNNSPIYDCVRLLYAGRWDGYLTAWPFSLNVYCLR